MKTRRIDFAYKPMGTSSYLEVVGSIPNKQAYDSSTNSYAPDYTLDGSNFVLQPHVYLIDKDDMRSGEVTPNLGSGTWYWKEITAVGNTSSEKIITTSNTDYILTTSGTNNGRIAMKRNVPIGGSITLAFHAEYTDTMTNDVYKVDRSIKITCENESSVPTLSIDKPTTNVWNPFRDTNTMTFNAFLKIGSAEMAVSNRAFLWEKKRSDGSWDEIGSDDHDDFGWSVTNNGATYTQNMNYIGEKQDMRVRVKYGDLSTAQYDDSQTVYFSMVRRLPDFSYDWGDVPDNIEHDVKTIYPKVIVNDREATVPNALDHLRATWYAGSGTSVGSPTMEKVGFGDKPGIPTSKINTNGMVLGLDLSDMGNYKRLYFTDANNVGHYVTQQIGGVNKLILCKTTK